MSLERKIQRLIIGEAEKGVPFSIDGLMNGSESDLEVEVYKKVIERLISEGDIAKSSFQPFPEDGDLSIFYETSKTD